jgi:predicted enzyme related to lactoylglutathione lyase
MRHAIRERITHLPSGAGISYLRIPAQDPQRTAAFYELVFGWTVDTNRSNPSFEDGTGHVIGHFVADHAVAGEAGVRPYIYVDSVDDAMRQVSAHGGSVVEAPYPEGDLWVATFRDPAGNVMGIWQRGPRDCTGPPWPTTAGVAPLRQAREEHRVMRLHWHGCDPLEAADHGHALRRNGANRRRSLCSFNSSGVHQASAKEAPATRRPEQFRAVCTG